MVCLIGFEIIHEVEVQKEMNAIEQVVAQKIRETIGARFFVQMQDQNDTYGLRNGAYSSSLIFAEEVNDEVYYFTLTSAPFTSFEYHKITTTDDPDTGDEPYNQSRAYKSKLFSDFYFSIPDIQLPGDVVYSDPESLHQIKWDDPADNVLTPPPQLS